jgi:SMODS-associating 4TM effector domain
MTNTILSKQNDSESIDLLKASTVAYGKAKLGEISITYFVLVLSIAFPVAYFLIKSENVKLVLFGFSFLLACLIEILISVFKENTSKGALFKEEFDTKVFDLPWKSTLKKPDPLDVLTFSQQYRGAEIKDWYSVNVSDAIGHNTAVAILQHSNTSWDIELRKSFRRWIVVFLVAYLLVIITFFFILNIGWLTLFLLLYSLHPFFTHFVSLIRGHSEVIRKRAEISNQLDVIICTKKQIGVNELRDIQDEIYITRQEAAKVPDFFFRLYKKPLNAVAEGYIADTNRIYEAESIT